MNLKGAHIKVMVDGSPKLFSTPDLAATFLKTYFVEHKGANEGITIHGEDASSPSYYLGRIDGNIVALEMTKLKGAI